MVLDALKARASGTQSKRKAHSLSTPSMTPLGHKVKIFRAETACGLQLQRLLSGRARKTVDLLPAPAFIEPAEERG